MGTSSGSVAPFWAQSYSNTASPTIAFMTTPIIWTAAKNSIHWELRVESTKMNLSLAYIYVIFRENEQESLYSYRKFPNLNWMLIATNPWDGTWDWTPMVIQTTNNKDNINNFNMIVVLDSNNIEDFSVYSKRLWVALMDGKPFIPVYKCIFWIQICSKQNAIWQITSDFPST